MIWGFSFNIFKMSFFLSIDSVVFLNFCYMGIQLLMLSHICVSSYITGLIWVVHIHKRLKFCFLLAYPELWEFFLRWHILFKKNFFYFILFFSLIDRKRTKLLNCKLGTSNIIVCLFWFILLFDHVMLTFFFFKTVHLPVVVHDANPS